MNIRLHIEAALAEGAMVSFSPEQAHYLRNVMRQQTGATVYLFNAPFGEFSAMITSLDKKGGAARVAEKIRDAQNEPDLWLLVAPIKRNPFETIIQKATELGVAAIMPVQTERTNGSKLNLERLSLIAREAAEQSERLSVPEIAASRKLDKLLDDWPSDRALIFCDEAGDAPDERWGGDEGRAAPMMSALGARDHAKKGAILIGPEGGFSPSERQALRAKEFVIPVSLGPRILRADTAAISAIALWQSYLGDMGQSYR